MQRSKVEQAFFDGLRELPRRLKSDKVRQFSRRNRRHAEEAQLDIGPPNGNEGLKAGSPHLLQGLEDPATGSAAGPAGAFIAKYGFVPADKAGSIVFLQGVLVRRPSRLHVRATMSGGEVTGIKVGGSSVVVGEGTMIP